MVSQTVAVPLQVPGGVEFLVIFLLLVVPLAIVAGAVYLVRQRSGDKRDPESHPEPSRIDRQ